MRLLLISVFFHLLQVSWGQKSEIFKGNTPGVVLVKREQGPTNARGISWPQQVQKARRVSKERPTQRGISSSLDNWYRVELKEGVHPSAFVRAMRTYPGIEKAELLPDYQLLNAYPNDPEADSVGGAQHYLKVIQAHEAWTVTTGDPAIRIGIVDTGIDLPHEDIQANLWVNATELTDGLDNDGNGYTDDRIGYDFADQDADAQADGNPHGTRVGGIAGATPNNLTGMAGVGYYSSLVPLKGYTSSGLQGTGLYEAIQYAADKGIEVLNLSWGTPNGYSEFYQDVIAYAVNERDVVVVAAAGNTPDDLDFYPASFNHVLSVGATQMDDQKWANSTFSHHIDLMAPGVGIFSTKNGNSYGTDNGSSYAAPQVAGAAALVRHQFPAYNAKQVMEQLRVTTEDIYAIGTNNTYRNMLGKGRLNVKRAVSLANAQSLRLENMVWKNDRQETYAFPGDTLQINFDWINYLAPSNHWTVELVTDDPYRSLTLQWDLGAMSTLESQPENLSIVIDESTPPDTELVLRFDMSDGPLKDFQHVTLRTMPDYFPLANHRLSLGISGNGDLARAGTNYQHNEHGYYHGNFVVPYMGLLVGNPDRMYNNAPENFSVPLRTSDFKTLRPIKTTRHPLAQTAVQSFFTTQDDQLHLEQFFFTHDSAHFLIQSYHINYTGTDTLRDMHVGLFIDFDLDTYYTNRVSWDTEQQALTFQSQEGGTWTQMAVVGESNYHALGMNGLDGNTQHISAQWSETDKINLITSAPIESNGTLGDGNDVAGLVSMRAGDIPPKGYRTVQFFIAFGSTADEVNANMEAARAYWKMIEQQPVIMERKLVCKGLVTYVPVTPADKYLYFADPLGTQPLGSGPQLNLDIAADTTFYLRLVQDGITSNLLQVAFDVSEIPLDWSSETDTLFMDGTPVTWNSSINPVAGNTYTWKLGATETVAHQVEWTIDTPGRYEVFLTVQNAQGCTQTFTRSLEVIKIEPLGVESGVDLVLYPNPSLGVCHIWTDGNLLNAKLQDANGKQQSLKLKKLSSNKWELNLDSVEPGLYFLKMMVGSRAISRKLIVR